MSAHVAVPRPDPWGEGESVPVSLEQLGLTGSCGRTISGNPGHPSTAMRLSADWICEITPMPILDFRNDHRRYFTSPRSDGLMKGVHEMIISAEADRSGDVVACGIGIDETLCF